MSVTIGQLSISIGNWRVRGTLEISSHSFSTQPLFDSYFAILQIPFMIDNMQEFYDYLMVICRLTLMWLQISNVGEDKNQINFMWP